MADELIFKLTVQDEGSSVVSAFERTLKNLERELVRLDATMKNTFAQAERESVSQLGQAENALRDFADTAKDSVTALKGFRGSFNSAFGKLGEPITSLSNLNDQLMTLAGGFAATGVKETAKFISDSVKNFAAYEDALASVQRTTGMTKTQVSDLGEALRTLALTDLKGQLVADDLVTIAEAAGQMGISGKKDILEFTKAVAQVSTAADVEIGKSALAFGKIATLFRESLGADAFQKIGNIGSAFDALADSSNASVEGILNYTNRLAGTANELKLTVDQTASFAATLEALGVPAERGSRALSDVFLQLKKNSASFADALEIDAEKLAVYLETSPVEAVNMVVDAMAKMKEARPIDFLKNMEDLMGKGSGVTEVMLKLAGGADMLKTNMAAAAKAMEDGTRAGQSAATAADTQAGSWRAVMTAVDDLKKSVGQQLQPTLNTLGTWLQSAATWWAGAFRADNINAFFDSVVAGFNAMTAGFKQDIDGMKEAWNALVNGITGGIEKIKGTASEAASILKDMIPGGGKGSVEIGGFEAGSSKALQEIQTASAELFRTNSDLKTQFFELRTAYNDAYADGGKPTEELVAATGRFKDALLGATQATPELSAAINQLDKSVMGADSAFEGKSLTPALRRYIEAALVSGTATGELTSEMQATMQGVLAADAAYTQLEGALTKNQQAVLALKKESAQLRAQKAAASDEEKAQIEESLKANSVKYANLMIEKSEIKERMSLAKEEIDLGKDAVAVFQDRQKAEEKASQERMKAEEFLQKASERTAELKSKQYQDEAKAANDLYQERQKAAADSIKWVNDLDEATKKRILGEKDAVKALQEQGVVLTDLQQQELARTQGAYQTEQAYLKQAEALQKQLNPMKALMDGVEKFSSGLGGLSSNLRDIGAAFGEDFAGGTQQLTDSFKQQEAALKTNETALKGIELQLQQNKLAQQSASGEQLAALQAEEAALTTKRDTMKLSIDEEKAGLEQLKESGKAYETVKKSMLQRTVEFLEKAKGYGDLVNTFGDLLGSLKSIGGGLGDVIGGIGSLLGGGGLGGLGSALGGLGGAGGLGSAISGILGLGGAATAAAPAVGGIAAAAGGAAAAAGGAAAGGVGLAASLGGVAAAAAPVAAVIGAIALAGWGLSKALEDTKSKGTEAADSFQEFVRKNVEGGAELEAALKTNFDAMGAAGFNFQTFLQQTGTTMDQTFGGISANWQEGSTAMDLFTQSIMASGVEMSKAPQVALQMMASFQDMGLSAEQAGAKMLEIAAASGMSAAQLESLKAALAATGSQASQTASDVSTYTDAQNQSATSTQDLANKNRDLQSALDAVGMSGQMTTDQMSSLSQAFLDAGADGAMSGQELSGLQDMLAGAGIKGKDAADIISKLGASIAAVPKEHDVVFRVRTEGQPPKFAQGGIVHSGLAIVNERGSEIAKFPGGSMALMQSRGAMLGAFPNGTEIIPHSKSMSILSQYPNLPRMASGGVVGSAMGTTINVTITGNTITRDTDLKALAQQVSAEISKSYNARR